jgi:hypothetical protein
MAFETDYSDVDDLCERIERDDPSLVGETCNIPVFRPHYLRSFVNRENIYISNDVRKPPEVRVAKICCLYNHGI